jgi:hypothetical protein
MPHHPLIDDDPLVETLRLPERVGDREFFCRALGFAVVAGLNLGRTADRASAEWMARAIFEFAERRS